MPPPKTPFHIDALLAEPSRPGHAAPGPPPPIPLPMPGPGAWSWGCRWGGGERRARDAGLRGGWESPAVRNGRADRKCASSLLKLSLFLAFRAKLQLSTTGICMGISGLRAAIFRPKIFATLDFFLSYIVQLLNVLFPLTASVCTAACVTLCTVLNIKIGKYMSLSAKYLTLVIALTIIQVSKQGKKKCDW